MSVRYEAVLWNPQKRVYDKTLAAGMVLYLLSFAGVGALLHPNATIETLLIRAFGTLALLMLHIILSIGPLCRLSPRFLPLLYNRRHLGVAMFLMALAHGVFSLIQFHALGDVNPLVSLLTSNARFDSIAEFPFQQLGLAGLIILFLMASTSHDFWLHTLTAGIWKRLHMLVYLAYGLLIAHVCLGALQSERSPWLAGVLGAGFLTVCGLHLAAGRRESRTDSGRLPQCSPDGFVPTCDVRSIPEGRAQVVTMGGERIAIFKHQGKVSALSNVCRHQNGPLGEGKIVDGCVTCPWHGYQYNPDTGMSPPPFHDQVPTFRTRVEDGRVWVQLKEKPEGQS